MSPRRGTEAWEDSGHQCPCQSSTTVLSVVSRSDKALSVSVSPSEMPTYFCCGLAHCPGEATALSGSVFPTAVPAYSQDCNEVRNTVSRYKPTFCVNVENYYYTQASIFQSLGHVQGDLILSRGYAPVYGQVR